MTTHDVLLTLFDKCEVKPNVRWTLVEQIPDLFIGESTRLVFTCGRSSLPAADHLYLPSMISTCGRSTLLAVDCLYQRLMIFSYGRSSLPAADLLPCVPQSLPPSLPFYIHYLLVSCALFSSVLTFLWAVAPGLPMLQLRFLCQFSLLADGDYATGHVVVLICFLFDWWFAQQAGASSN